MQSVKGITVKGHISHLQNGNLLQAPSRPWTFLCCPSFGHPCGLVICPAEKGNRCCKHTDTKTLDSEWFLPNHKRTRQFSPSKSNRNGHIFLHANAIMLKWSFSPGKQPFTRTRSLIPSSSPCFLRGSWAAFQRTLVQLPNVQPSSTPAPN